MSYTVAHMNLRLLFEKLPQPLCTNKQLNSRVHVRVIRSITRTTFLINIDAILQSPIGYNHQSISGHLNFPTTIVAAHETDVIMSKIN